LKDSKDVIIVSFLKRNLFTAKVKDKTSELKDTDKVLNLETRQAKSELALFTDDSGKFF